MPSTTPYLSLVVTPLQNTSWYGVYRENLAKIDRLGKYLRMQASAGKSMAIRAELSSGALVNAITITPVEGEDRITINLGRAGKNDRVVIESSSLFSSLNMSNQNVQHTDKTCSVGVTWADEDGVSGDAIQDTTVVLDVRNNLRTSVVFPAASQFTVTNPNAYVGSQLQLSCDPSGTGEGLPFLKFICETTTGTTTYLVPAYTL